MEDRKMSFKDGQNEADQIEKVFKQCEQREQFGAGDVASAGLADHLEPQQRSKREMWTNCQI